MKIEELIKLADAGYTPDLVSKLLALDSSPAPNVPIPKEPEQAPGPDPEPAPAPGEKEEEKEEPDYKKLYEESQAALKKTQTALVRQNVADSSSEQSLEEKVQSIFASYYS